MRDAEAAADFRSNDAECPPRGARALAALSVEPAAPGDDSGRTRRAAARLKAPSRPWALQLIGDRSKSAAIQQFASLRQQFPTILGSHAPEVVPRRVGGRLPTYWYQIRVSEASRQRATTLCTRLKSAGGQCLVIRN